MSRSETMVRCYRCGRRVPALAPACGRCLATFEAMCSCAAVLSVFDEQCGACGAPNVPKRLPRSRTPLVRAAKAGLVVFALVAALWLVVVPRPVPTWRLKAQAREAFLAGDFEAAAPAFRAVTEQAPGDADGWYSLAVTYRRLGFPADSFVPPAEKAVLLAPDNFPARDLLARTELSLGRADKALEHAEAAVRAVASNGAAWQLLAEIMLACPRPDLARVQRALETARSAGQDTAEVRVMLAEVSIRLNGAYAGRPERMPPGFDSSLRAALAALDSPRARGGDPAAAAARRARIELALGRADAAFAVVDEALAELPEDATSETTWGLRLLRAMARFARGDRPQAMSEFASVLRARPDAATAASTAAFLESSGAPDLARAALSAAADAGDPRGDVHAVLAGVLLSQDDAVGASRAAAVARTISPQDAFFAEIDGSACAAQRRFDAARAAFSDAARAAPRLASPRVRLALLPVAEAEGAPQIEAAQRAAVVELEELRRKFGDDALLLEALGRLRLATGDAEAARVVLERAAEQVPADPAVWTLLAEARRLSGGERALDGAVAAYDRARRLRPDDASIATAAAALRLTAGDASVAVDACTEFLRRRPDEASVLRMRAACLRQLRMWAASAQDFRRLRSLPGTTDADAAQWVDALYRAGDAAAARDAAAEARGTLSDAGVRELEFLAAVHEGDAETALAKLRESGATTLLASIQFATGRIDAALQTLREAWRADPGGAAAARLYVAALLEAERPPKERLAEARAVFAALARPAAPGYAEFVEGRILLAEGDATGSVARLRVAQRELPLDPLVALYLGEALFVAGERNESLAALRRAAALPGAPPSVPRIVAVHLHRASLDARDVDRAESLALEALRYDATVTGAAFRAIALLHARGSFVDAAELADRRLALGGLSDDDAARLHLLRANDRLCAGDFQAVESIVESLPPGVRDSTTGRLLAAYADAGAGRLDAAEKRFESVLAGDPASGFAVAGLVLVDVGRGDRAAAVARVERWRTTHPDDRDVSLAASQFLSRAGHLDDAARLAGACAAARPSDPSSASAHAAMLRRAGRGEDAVAAARRFAAAAPKERATDAALFAATVAVRCRVDVGSALAAARAVRDDSAVSDASRALAAVVEAEALSALGHGADATSVAQAVVTEIVGSPVRGRAARALEARARFVLGYSAATASPPRRAQAIEEFSKCLALDPLDVDAANDLAWLLAQDAATAQRAFELARRVTELVPSSSAYWDTRAEAARRVGDFADAAASWTKALTVAASPPKDDPRRRAALALRYARFLRERKDERGARAVVESAIAGVEGTASEGELRRFLGD